LGPNEPRAYYLALAAAANRQGGDMVRSNVPKADSRAMTPLFLTGIGEFDAAGVIWRVISGYNGISIARLDVEHYAMFKVQLTLAKES